MPDYTLNGSPLIVKNTFIDMGDPAPFTSSSHSGRRRASSLPAPCEAAGPTETLGDLRCRCFSAHTDVGRFGGNTGSSSSASSDRGSPAAQHSHRQLAEGASSSSSGSPRSGGQGGPPGAADAAQDGSDSDAEGPMTTVMLRNLPEVFNRDMLLGMLDSNGFTACYDFVYLPIDFGSRCSFGYAFINLVNPEVASRFMKYFQGFGNWSVPCEKVADVNWSGKRQGLQRQIDRYRNSPMMHAKMPDEAKPIVLRDGLRVEFPPPTQPVKPLRVRPSKTRRAHDLGLDVIGDDVVIEGDACG